MLIIKYLGNGTTTNKPKLGTWTEEENFIICDHYLDMLARELRAERYNKAQNRRDGLATMAATRADKLERSHGSWEMKACNISAVMRTAGLPWINGYKPLGHGQQKALARALVAMMLAQGWNDDDIAAVEKVAQ